MQALPGDSDLDWGGSPSAEPAPRNLRAGGSPLRSVISQECEGAHIATDLGGNLDRQSDCRDRARTAARLAARGKQALASLTSLRLAGQAGIAAARRFHAAAQIAHLRTS